MGSLPTVKVKVKANKAEYIISKSEKDESGKVKRNKWRNLREMVKWWQTGRLQGMD